jgi:hypothetical protein
MLIYIECVSYDAAKKLATVLNETPKNEKLTAIVCSPRNDEWGVNIYPFGL